MTSIKKIQSAPCMAVYELHVPALMVGILFRKNEQVIGYVQIFCPSIVGLVLVT